MKIASIDGCISQNENTRMSQSYNTFTARKSDKLALMNYDELEAKIVEIETERNGLIDERDRRRAAAFELAEQQLAHDPWRLAAVVVGTLMVICLLVMLSIVAFALAFVDEMSTPLVAAVVVAASMATIQSFPMAHFMSRYREKVRALAEETLKGNKSANGDLSVQRNI